MLDKIIILLATAYKVDPKSINRETNFQKDLSLNSMSLVESIVEIEDMYEVEIPEKQLFKMHTIGDLVDFLEKNVTPEMKAANA